MIVIYAEKPDQGRKIAAALGITGRGTGEMHGSWNGHDAMIVWGFGHMCSLKHAPDYNPDYKNWSNIPLPFIPETYEIMPKKDPKTRAIDAGVKKQLDTIKRALRQKGATVICATDDDREGELIFAYVCDYVGFKGAHKRVQLNSMTEDGIRDAFSKLKDGAQFKNKTDAGRGRSIADWVVGINLTTAATTQFLRGKGQLSIGRVQTATLNMVVERELEIRNFVSKPFYTVMAEITSGSGNKYIAQHKAERFDTRPEAQAILDKIAGANAVITDIQFKEKKYSPPILHSQTTLQMASNSQHGLTLQQTLDAAQSLYEKGFITYPRTSSQYLTNDMKGQTDEVVKKLGKMSEYSGYVSALREVKVRDYVFNDKKVESHFAIIPTGNIPNGLSKHEAQVFDVIAKSLIRLTYPDAIVKNTAITHDARGEVFIAKGTEIVQAGWFDVAAMPKTANMLPSGLSVGDSLSAVYGIKEGKTEPPKRYTDKTLVSAMAAAGKTIKDAELREILTDPTHAGIGTEATRAGIVETLERRGYISRKGKQFYAEDAGIALIQVFPINELKSPVITAEWEKRLAQIERGEEGLSAFVSDIEAATADWCAQIKGSRTEAVISTSNEGEAVGECPVCKKPAVFTKAGLSCSGWREGCKFVLWRKVAGKTLTDSQLKSLLTKGATKEIKGFVSKKSGKKFNARLVLNEEHKVVFDFGETKKSGFKDDSADGSTKDVRLVPLTQVACPICSGQLRFTSRGLSCSRWDDIKCGFIIWKKIAEKELDDKTMLILATGQAVGPLDGFKSKKTGKNFSAKLVLDREFKISFQFDK